MWIVDCGPLQLAGPLTLGGGGGWLELKRGNQTKELWENLKAEIKISNQREKYKSGIARAGGRLKREGGVKM
jgi:hypothetical protein